MSPAIYMAYNLSIVWIFCTFGIVPEPVTGTASAAIVTIPVWMVYSLVQIAALGIFIILGRRMERVAENGVIAILAAAMMVGGALLMKLTTGTVAAIGCLVAGLGGVFLMLPWSAISSQLEVRGFEQMMLGSTGVAFAMMLVMSFVPEPARYICAQSFPVVSAILALRVLRGSQHAVERTSSGSGGEADRAWKPMRQIQHLDAKTIFSAIIAIVVPAALTFILFFFIAAKLVAEKTGNSAFFAVAGFLLAFVIVTLFLRFTPSVNLTFIYRWQAGFLAATVAVLVFWAQEGVAFVVVSALMVVTSQFTWAFFGKVNRSTDVGYVRTFMGGLLLVQTGITLGSCIAYALSVTIDPSLAGSAAAVIVLLIMVVGFVLMPTETRPAESPLPEPPQENDEALALDMARRYALSARETEVFLMLVKGRSAPYIRDQLYISQNTVNTHIKHIYAKTGTHTRQEVIDLFEGEKTG